MMLTQTQPQKIAKDNYKEFCQNVYRMLKRKKSKIFVIYSISSAKTDPR